MLYEDFFVPELTLQSERVTLRRLLPTDQAALWQISQDPALWSWFNRELNQADQLEAWLEEAALQREQKSRFPFLVIDRKAGAVAGSTSFGNISFPDRRIEIGWTWYGADFRGTGINLHCKFLLMQFAFETLGFERVEIKTDALNARSRAAIRKLGMLEEGTLRSHMQMPHNRRRDSTYYSMLASEWTSAKGSIAKLLR